MLFLMFYLRINLLYLILYLVSCATINVDKYNKEEIIGEYKTDDKITFIDIINIRGKQIRTSLLLNQDSTFRLKTCAQETKGIWKIKNDSLLLYCQTKKFNIDSFNYVPFYSQSNQCSQKPQILMIKKKGKKARIIEKDYYSLRQRYILDLRKISTGL